MSLRSKDEKRQILARAMRVVHQVILYSETCPEEVASLAKRMRATKEATLAYMITDQVFHEFDFVPREELRLVNQQGRECNETPVGNPDAVQ